MESPASNGDIINLLTEKLRNEADESIEKLKKIRDELDSNVSALESFRLLYPDIPIIHGDKIPIKASIESFRGPRSLIIDSAAATFFIQDLEDEKYLAKEMTYMERISRLRIINEIDLRDGEGFFEGKNVISDEVYNEDDKIITLPHYEDSGEVNENYCNEIHRDKDGDVVSNDSVFDPKIKDEEQYVLKFAGLPWHVKKIDNGNLSNVIFRNLYTDEIRRYITHMVDHRVFFMLKNEFYYFHTKECDTDIIECRSGKVIDTIMGFVASTVASCRDYVAATNQLKGEFIVIRTAI